MNELNKEQKLNRELNNFFNLSLDFMVIADEQGFFTQVNKACIETLGYSKDELLSNPFLKFVHPDDQERTKKEYQKMVEDNVPYIEFSNRYVKKNGEIIWVKWNISINNKIAYAMGHNITKAKEDSYRYQQTQDQLKLALEGAQFGTWSIDLVNKKVFYDAVAKNIHGVKELSDNLNDFFDKLVHPEDQEQVKLKWQSAIENHSNYYNEFRIIHSDGTIRWVLALGRAQYNEKNIPTHLFGIVSDITERKNKEELRKTLATLVEQSQEMVVVLNLDLKVIFLNQEAKTKLNLPDFHDLYLSDIIDGSFQGQLYREILPSVRLSSFWSGEVLLKTNKSNIVNSSFSIFPIHFNGHGQNFAYGIVARDIQKEKCWEQEQVQARKKLEILAGDLRSALAARDTFIAIASHELKTPITSLKLHSQLNKKIIERDGFSNLTKQQIDKIINTPIVQADRLIKLINDMLDISLINAGQISIKKEKINISKLINDILDSFTAQFIKASCSLVKVIEPDLFGYWDGHRIDQAVSNIISNALKYAPGKPIKVSLKKEGSSVLIAIKDQGPGIHKDTQLKIFNRFERGVPNSVAVAGLGLGLYLAKYIIDSHGGVISVFSEPEQGSEFIIKLPIN